MIPAIGSLLLPSQPQRSPSRRHCANKMPVPAARCAAQHTTEPCRQSTAGNGPARRQRCPPPHSSTMAYRYSASRTVTAMHHSKICSHSSRLKIESAPHCAAPCTGVWRVGMAAPKNSSSSRWTAASKPSADAANVTALRQRWPGCGGQKANSRYSGGSAS